MTICGTTPLVQVLAVAFRARAGDDVEVVDGESEARP
jgi:hypothetical protein